MEQNPNLRKVVFFDGICGLCNRFVDLLLVWDKKHVLRFASLQGQTADQVLPQSLTENLNTLVFYHNCKIHLRSNAVIEILCSLGGGWKLTRIFYLIPRFIRDWLYALLASRRYSLFGKRNSCRLPKPEERAYFLD